jgi:hypothetical protein
MKLSLIALAAGFCLVVGLPLAATAGPATSADGADLDGVGQAFDNCTDRNNPNQKDFDHDGCGDACDCDFNQDGVTGAFDISTIIACSPSPNKPYVPICDLTCDGAIGAPDIAICLSEFQTDLPFRRTGPSGILAANRPGSVLLCSGGINAGKSCTVPGDCPGAACAIRCGTPPSAP